MMGVRVLKEREQVKEERGNRFKCKGRLLPRLAKAATGLALIICGMQGVPFRASAAGSLETSASQVQVGTLPLLAALGIGIAVAVGSVIAFLQMTAKGKESSEASQMSPDEDHEPYEDNSLDEWNDEETMPNPEYDDNPLTDYTIPVTKILAYPGEAELADGKEPRICGVEGEHAGSCYRIMNRRLTFGRDPALSVILFPYEAGEISRLHCTLRFMEENRLFILEDNGSSNGTFLSNGERLKPGVRYELRAGERFSLSGKEHVFEVRDEEGQRT